MRRIKFYSFASTLVLASAMGLSSCSSDSAETGGTPGVAGETVKTLFAINVPYGKDDSSAKPHSRMGANETQANGNFTGLEKMRLLTLTSEPGTNGATSYTSNINIGDGDNAYAKDAWRSLYREVQIPIGTTNFVLYGRAIKNDDYAKYGDIRINAAAFNNDAAGNLSDIYFKLRTISDNADFSTNTYSTAILNLLNALAKTEATYNPTQQGTSTTEEKTVRWSEVTEESPSDYRSQSERKILADKYKQLTSLEAGSANSVKSFLNGLIDYFSDENIAQGSSLTAAIVSNANDALGKLSRNDFPEDLGLPDGIAKLKWSNGEFAYITADNTTIGNGNKIDYTKITYPACLGYMVSSPAMVSNTELTNVTGLPTYDTWVKDPASAWSAVSGFSQAAVSNTTKTVALRNALQYGVANMKLSIRASEENLKDNLKAIDPTRDDQIIKVPGSGFTVTGVLIGGQPDQVEWDYEPSATTGFNHTIYDTKMNTENKSDGEFKAKYSAGTPSEFNYTLVFDNKNKKQTNQDDVYVTVELVNNAGDFYGVDGLVPQGGKFYLVGKLSVDNATADSKKDGIDHIFVKDHTTTVNLAFKDLKNAYNCIPDLRTSKISLGLAVSLEWQAGLTFDVEIGK